MTMLRITEMKCVKKQDSISKDEVRIDIDGNRLSGPHTMKKKQVLPLAATHIFTGSDVKIALWEEDKGKNNDDCLGTHTVRASQAGQGTQQAYFNALKKADYHIKYNVTA